MLRQRLEHVRERIQHASRRCGRSASAITLIGVTKGVPVEVIQAAISLGLADIGESRVQEARAKQLAVGRSVRWHLVGSLQRNKAKGALELFDLIHSVDSPELINTLNRLSAGRSAAPVGVFIQVSVSGEASKHGCRPEDITALARRIRMGGRFRLEGLMTIAPFGDDPEQARPHFRRLRQLREALAAELSLKPEALRLSMGMSQDFEVAIEEGADVVRIGTALFGPQPVAA